MAYVLIPPTVMEGPSARTTALFSRVRYPHGVSLLVTGSSVVEVRGPSIEMQREADATYLGGHRYTLTDEQAQPLIDAGYGSPVLERSDVYVDEYEEKY